jgi:hypothetical protein
MKEKIMKFTPSIILSLCLTPTLLLSACNNAGASSTTPLPCDSSLVINTSSNTISSVESYAQQINCPVPAVNICTAFDIDNTLITNEPNLGGEAWGNWQEYLTESDPNNPYLATNWLSNVGIFQAQSGIRFLINFKPVEPITATSIAGLQAKYQTIAISSRAFSSLATTTRQLAANQIDMSVNPIGDHQFDNSFLQQNKYKNDLKMYYDGIYYVAGSSKGETLLNMIQYYRKKMNQPNLCEVLIMLDDTPSKINDIILNLKGQIGIVGINYTALPQAVNPANWYPQLWESQSPELMSTIYNLNHQ